MKLNKSVTTLLLLVALVGGVLAYRNLRPDAQEALKKRIAERSKGDPSAKVWITEYFDYQCPPCANAYKILEEEMLKDPKRIYLQVRYFPLPVHKNSMKAAIHAECASRQSGKFWKLHESIFQHQSEWANDPYAELKFLQYAQEAGLDVVAWDACTKDPEVEKFVSEEKAKGSGLGVKITPTFFVNGKMAVGNNAMKEELEKTETAQDHTS